MQPEGGFHSRAVRFTEENSVGGLASRCSNSPTRSTFRLRGAWPNGSVRWRPRSRCRDGKRAHRRYQRGLTGAVAHPISAKSRTSVAKFFTMRNRRKTRSMRVSRICCICFSACFEDTGRTDRVAQAGIRTPGIPACIAPAVCAERQPHPDIAIFEGGITHVITTSKWSIGSR